MTISFIPKSWKKPKQPSHSRDSSSTLSDPRPHHLLSASINSSTSSTLVEPLKHRKRSVSLDRGQDPTPIPLVMPQFAPPKASKSSRPSTAPHGSSRRSHAQPIDKGFVRLRAPSDASRSLISLQSLPVVPHAANSSASTRSTPTPTPTFSTTSRGPGSSPTATKLQSTDRYLSKSPAPSSNSRRVRVKKSMPELDGVWKGFLEDVNENLDSIRLDLEWADEPQLHSFKSTPDLQSESLRPRPTLDMSLPTPVSAMLRSINSTSFVSPNRQGTSSRSEATSPKSPVPNFYMPYYGIDACSTSPPSDIRNEFLSPIASPSLRHERDISAEFPLSLFPIPPPLTQTPTIKNQLLPDSSTRSPPQQPIVGGTPPKPRPPPRSPARRHAPQPLEMRPVRVAVDYPYSPDSPPPSTPTTPRFSHSPYTAPLSATNATIPLSKKKSSVGPGGRTLPTPPTTPDQFGYTSTSPEPYDSYRPEKAYERPGLRAAYSSSQLRGYTTPPPGAHRATMSETVNPLGGTRTPSRPLVSTLHGPLQGDAYLYPRPAPDPSTHVQWGYAV